MVTRTINGNLNVKCNYKRTSLCDSCKRLIIKHDTPMCGIKQNQSPIDLVVYAKWRLAQPLEQCEKYIEV
jgi:hypothetical protein